MSPRSTRSTSSRGAALFAGGIHQGWKRSGAWERCRPCSVAISGRSRSGRSRPPPESGLNPLASVDVPDFCSGTSTRNSLTRAPASQPVSQCPGPIATPGRQALQPASNASHPGASASLLAGARSEQQRNSFPMPLLQPNKKAISARSPPNHASRPASATVAGSRSLPGPRVWGSRPIACRSLRSQLDSSLKRLGGSSGLQSCPAIKAQQGASSDLPAHQPAALGTGANATAATQPEAPGVSPCTHPALFCHPPCPCQCLTPPAPSHARW